MIKINHRLVAEDLLEFLNTDSGNFGYYVLENEGKLWRKESDDVMYYYTYTDPDLANEDIKTLNKIKEKL